MKISHLKHQLPVISILIGAVFWGLIWWPLKFFASAGLTGNFIGLTAYLIVGLAALPIVWAQHRQWRAEAHLLLLIGLFFALANIFFTTALMQGNVVRVMLLFYLLPAWGALGGKLLLNETLGLRRIVAVGLSLAGVVVIMGGTSILSTAFSMVDFMALAAGFCLTASSIVNRKAMHIPITSRSLIPFIFCPPLAFLGNYLYPTPMPHINLAVWLYLALFAFIWLFAASAFSSYGFSKVEASKAAILQVTELFVAIITATLIGGEVLETKEYVGGALIVIATVLEAMPTKNAS